MYFPTPPMKDNITGLLQQDNDLTTLIQRTIFKIGLDKEIKSIEMADWLFAFASLIKGTIGEISSA